MNLRNIIFTDRIRYIYSICMILFIYEMSRKWTNLQGRKADHLLGQEKGAEMICNEHEEFFGVMKMSSYCTVVMAAHLNKLTQNHHNEHLEWVNCMECISYLNKTVKHKNRCSIENKKLL